MNYVIIATNSELYHHGIKGQKWGVRRYQNYDGSLTLSGKKHRTDNSTGLSPKQKNVIKKVAISAATLSTAAAAIAYAKKNPKAIAKIIIKAKKLKVSALSSSAITKGKEHVTNALKNAKKGVVEGLKESIKEAPKKATKAVVTGMVLNATKKALDKAVGKKESDRIFQANDPKKIGKFWKVQEEDREKDE